MTVAPWKAASPTEQSATQREVCLNHGGRLAEPQRGPAPGPDGSNSICHLRELRVSARPQLHGWGTGLGAPAGTWPAHLYKPGCCKGKAT